MIQKVKSYLLIAAATFALAAPLAVAAPASAACTNIGDKISEGANKAAEGPGAGADCGTANVGEGSITELANDIVNIFSIIVGIVAVIMIIYGGFRYITSGGDSGRVGNAKNTLIYAIIGLIIVALAQIIVKFVLNQTGSVTS